MHMHEALINDRGTFAIYHIRTDPAPLYLPLTSSYYVEVNAPSLVPSRSC